MKALMAMIFFGAISISFGQSKSPIVCARVFFQEIIPGVAPAMSDEGEVIRNRKRYSYRIYLECKPNARVRLLSVNVNGKVFAAREAEAGSPVAQFHPTTLQSDTLIQATSNRVLRVEQAGAAGETWEGEKPKPSVKIVYSYKGKRHSIRAKKYIELAPIAMP